MEPVIPMDVPNVPLVFQGEVATLMGVGMEKQGNAMPMGVQTQENAMLMVALLVGPVMLTDALNVIQVLSAVAAIVTGVGMAKRGSVILTVALIMASATPTGAPSAALAAPMGVLRVRQV